MRNNTHLYNLADTVPSEGERDLTLALGSNPHRIRAEVNGDHILLMYKDRGEGGWILIDERDFPEFGDGPRYVQVGFNLDSTPAGLIYVDNLEVRGVAAERAVVSRTIGAENFEPDAAIPMSLLVTLTGSIPALEVMEDFPEGWLVSDISHGGVVSDGTIIWSLKNLTETTTLTYSITPPRLIRARVARFSGSADSGDGPERITGDTVITILLPYVYREAIDYDFSGSPVDGRNYPTEGAYAERYTQGMDGIPTDVFYDRPTADGSTPAIDQEFVFPPDADFFQGNPAGVRGDGYTFDDYRDFDEVGMEHGASDTNASIGSIDGGDWWRYTFDLGPDDQVLILNMSFDTWGQGECLIDVYVDNKFKGEIRAPNTRDNEFNFFSVRPFEVSGGEHSIVVAFPQGVNVPTDFGRMEVVRVKGVGQVTRKLTEEGFFEPSEPLTVSLEAEALYGSYTPYIEENLPQGVSVTEVSDGGQVIGDTVIWGLEATTTSKTVTYTLAAAEGSRFLIFSGMCDVGLPLADRIHGDTSVTNEVWLFGKVVGTTKQDDFDGNALTDPWVIEYGTDPAFSNYDELVSIGVAEGLLTVHVDPLGVNNKFDEWSAGRRAPIILRTDLPANDWRIETVCTLTDTVAWSEYHVGIVVAYNDGSDTDVSGDEYLFGFYSDDIRVELTGEGASGVLEYHSYTDENDWFDFVLYAGEANVTLAVTKRSDELIFSAKLPDRPWQLVGPPASETRAPTRVGLFSKIWGDTNFSNAAFDYFTLSELDVFTGLEAWELY